MAFIKRDLDGNAKRVRIELDVRKEYQETKNSSANSPSNMMSTVPIKVMRFKSLMVILYTFSAPRTSKCSQSILSLSADHKDEATERRHVYDPG